MKVDVITVDEVKIGKFRWWSNWIDICIFDTAGISFLVQMRISRTNGKSFRTIRIAGGIWRHCHARDINDLRSMKKC